MEVQEVQSSPRMGLPRRDEMKTPDDVSAMVRLKRLGWGGAGPDSGLSQRWTLAVDVARCICRAGRADGRAGLPHHQAASRRTDFGGRP